MEEAAFQRYCEYIEHLFAAGRMKYYVSAREQPAARVKIIEGFANPFKGGRKKLYKYGQPRCYTPECKGGACNGALPGVTCKYRRRAAQVALPDYTPAAGGIAAAQCKYLASRGGQAFCEYFGDAGDCPGVYCDAYEPGA